MILSAEDKMKQMTTEKAVNDIALEDRAEKAFKILHRKVNKEMATRRVPANWPRQSMYWEVNLFKFSIRFKHVAVDATLRMKDELLDKGYHVYYSEDSFKNIVKMTWSF